MDTYDNVKEYYGEVLESTKSLKTNACTLQNKPSNTMLRIMKKIPCEIKNKFYGCGSTIPLGIEGLNVVDLGSGSGQDCYISSALVGEDGYVTGIDMTDEQLEVANKYVDEYTNALGYDKPNMVFKKGYIEYLDKLDIPSNSVDLVISNCVLNLSPNKKEVIKGVHHILKDNGSFYFSDVYCDRRLDETVTTNKVLWGECIAGALYENDFKRICREVGFTEIREMERSIIEIEDPKLKEIVGNAKFYSITYHLFKISSLETLCEDYGQFAMYKGTIPDMEDYYILDNHHKFVKSELVPVCGNTADILSKTWLSDHFLVNGNKNVHLGLFNSCYENVSITNIKKSCC